MFLKSQFVWIVVALAMPGPFSVLAESAEGQVALPIRKARLPREGNPAIRLDVRLVLIPVTVTDPLGAPFAGLGAQAFRVFEDGVEQRLKSFSVEDAPISLGIIFDASRSMTRKLEHSRAAVARMFQTAIPGDEYFLVEFNDRARILCDFTPDPADVERTLSGVRPKNWTSLLDAVYLGVHHMRHAKNSRRALLILSDGADNNSRYTETEMRNIVREADVCVYSVGFSTWSLGRHHIRLLRDLSEETGGQFREITQMADLPTAIEKISAAIRHQYLLGYIPSNAKLDGLYRKVQVRVEAPPNLPRLRASWRTGYYSPAGAGSPAQQVH